LDCYSSSYLGLSLDGFSVLFGGSKYMKRVEEIKYLIDWSYHIQLDHLSILLEVEGVSILYSKIFLYSNSMRIKLNKGYYVYYSIYIIWLESVYISSFSLLSSI